MKNNDAPGIPPPDIVAQVRNSSRNGAASLIGHVRKDVLEELAARTVHTFIKEFQNDPGSIKNPASWAYRVGRNEAQAWLKDENRFVPLDSLMTHPDDGGENLSFDRQPLLVSETPFVEDREEILQALPELFEWFESEVLNQLDSDDRLFYEMFYIDKLSEDWIARELNITPKSVAQRWRRLLVRMRRQVTRKLPGWDRHQLFSGSLKDTKGLLGLLCLVRLFVEEGMDAIRAIVDSFEK